MKKKFYAVKSGRQPGIYPSWEACREQVMGYHGAIYKSFATEIEARSYLGEVPSRPETKNPAESCRSLEIYVDGSYRADTAEYAYGVVVLAEGEELCFAEKFSEPELAPMRNVAGEIRGAMAAMQYAVQAGYDRLHLYYDYAGIRHWCTGEWQANKSGTQAYRDFYRDIEGMLKVEFHKVKSHSNNRYNDLADKLAKEVLGIA